MHSKHKVSPHFKTLGAKRYLIDINGELNLTVSGINKKSAVPYLLKHFKTIENVFDNFKEGLEIPRGYSGKNTHTYIDNETQGTIRDYKGKEYNYHELSSVHIEEAPYILDIKLEYLNYILGGREQVYNE